jgi:hypothetical protein
MKNLIWNEATIETILKSAIEQVVNTPTMKLGEVPYTKLVYRMLQALFDKQTAYEQAAKHTKHTNGVGFNGPDSVVLSDIATKSRKFKNLTPKQTRLVAIRLVKYRKQLAGIAAAKTQPALAA